MVVRPSAGKESVDAGWKADHFIYRHHRFRDRGLGKKKDSNTNKEAESESYRKQSTCTVRQAAVYLQGDEPPLALQYFFPRIFENPLPPFENSAKLSNVASKFGGDKLPCISSGESIALGPAVCFDSVSPIIRWVSEGTLQLSFNQIIRFDSCYLAKQISVAGDHAPVLTVRLDLIEGLASWPTELFVPSPGTVRMERVSSPGQGVSPPKPLKEVPPQYPMVALGQRLQGRVVVAAVIGSDGSVRRLEPVASPGPVLTKAAIDTFKKWKFRPATDHRVSAEAIRLND